MRWKRYRIPVKYIHVRHPCGVSRRNTTQYWPTPWNDSLCGRTPHYGAVGWGFESLQAYFHKSLAERYLSVPIDVRWCGTQPEECRTVLHSSAFPGCHMPRTKKGTPA